jgi:hypothetical protein
MMLEEQRNVNLKGGSNLGNLSQFSKPLFRIPSASHSPRYAGNYNLYIERAFLRTH